MSDSLVRQKISAYIITKNEEKNIVRAVESVSWMDEIIVIDSGSTDNTIQLARDHGATVIVSGFEGFVIQKNKALDACSNDWVFNLDADEEVTSELRRSIERVLSLPGEQNTKVHTVYRVPRKTWYMGRWIQHCGWYPEYRSRLSRKGEARWTGDAIHESLEGNGESGTLTGDLLHRPYADIGEHLETIGRYTLIWARREKERGRRAHVFDLVLRPPIRFCKMFILRAGFLDGLPGFVASVMGMIYTFLKYARLYEVSGKDG